jgi:hypothetical protein
MGKIGGGGHGTYIKNLHPPPIIFFAWYNQWYKINALLLFSLKFDRKGVNKVVIHPNFCA